MIHGFDIDPYSKMFHPRDKLPGEFASRRPQDKPKTPALFVVRTLEPAQ